VLALRHCKRGGVVSSPSGGLETRLPAVDGAGGKLVCDKCDGPHATDRCPHFRKDRDKHRDAWTNYGAKAKGRANQPEVFVSGRVVSQPGDGSCLFHSLSYGLSRQGQQTNAHSLRREIAQYIERNPGIEVAETPLADWVKWDSGQSASGYARRMAGGGWGGAIEMAACALLKGCSVHVYERYGSRFKRISTFGERGQPVNVLYCGRVHYDALVV
jgi:hypothetical protein